MCSNSIECRSHAAKREHCPPAAKVIAFEANLQSPVSSEQADQVPGNHRVGDTDRLGEVWQVWCASVPVAKVNGDNFILGPKEDRAVAARSQVAREDLNDMNTVLADMQGKPSIDEKAITGWIDRQLHCPASALSVLSANSQPVTMIRAEFSEPMQKPWLSNRRRSH